MKASAPVSEQYRLELPDFDLLEVNVKERRADRWILGAAPSDVQKVRKFLGREVLLFDESQHTSHELEIESATPEPDPGQPLELDPEGTIVGHIDPWFTRSS